MLKNFLSEFIDTIIHIFYNNTCPICTEKELENQQLICKKCIKENTVEDLYLYDNNKHYFDILFFGCIYNNKTKKIVYGIKNKDRYFDVASFFILNKLDLYFEKFYLERRNEYSKRFDYIVYVPSNKSKKRTRKYVQSKKIAHILSQKLNVEMLNIFTADKSDKEQKDLNRNERFNNIKDKFHIVDKKYIDNIRGKSILIIDDVYTTGATVDALSNLLKEVGAKKIAVAVFARAIL